MENFLFSILVIFFFKYLSRLSYKLYYCLSYFLVDYAVDGLNKNSIRLSLFQNQKNNDSENNQSVVIIPINKIHILNIFDENLNNLLNKKEINLKKNYSLKSSDKNYNEKQNKIIEENKKK